MHTRDDGVGNSASLYCLPPFAEIPDEIDIVCHGPEAGYVDGGSGCSFLLQHVARARPMAVVCGHIHQAHGIARGREADGVGGTVFINAANAGGHGAKPHSQALGWPPVVLDVPLKPEPFSGDSGWARARYVHAGGRCEGLLVVRSEPIR